MLLSSLSGRQAKALRHSSQGHRPRNQAPQTFTPCKGTPCFPLTNSYPPPSLDLSVFIRLPRRSLGGGGWLEKAFLRNEPILKFINHCLYVGCDKRIWLRFPKRTHSFSLFSLSKPFKGIQSVSKLFKGFGKKIINSEPQRRGANLC